MIGRIRLGGDSSACRRALSIAAVLTVAACASARGPITATSSATDPVSQLQLTIERALAEPALARGTWGIQIRSLERDQILYALNDHKLLMPASTLKIVTLAAAAERLGWEYQFHTRVYAAGPIEDGVLRGDVLIVGSGDPTIDDWSGDATRVFTEWATRLREAGVQTIGGRIIGDDDLFEDNGLGNGWAWDDLGASYATSVGGLQFNQNTAQLVITPGTQVGDRPFIDVRPDAARLTLRNLAITSDAGSPLSVRLLPNTSTLEIKGSFPAGSQPVTRNVSVPNPTLYFATAFRDALVREGIAVSGAAADIDDLFDRPERSAMRLVVDHVSPSLLEIAKTMMAFSQNLYAETLLKTLGALDATEGSTAAGRAVVTSRLAAWGVPADEVMAVDGSGLSRYNVATPAALTGVLDHVFRDARMRDGFLQALPAPGTAGTFAARLVGTSAAGSLRAKSGSFTNARALCGYVRTADNELLAFAILANNYGVEPAVIDRATDAIVSALATFSRT